MLFNPFQITGSFFSTYSGFFYFMVIGVCGNYIKNNTGILIRIDDIAENMNWDLSWTEGNHWQCPNYYDAIIYMKEWGKRYDRAIANKKFYTNGNLGLSLD